MKEEKIIELAEKKYYEIQDLLDNLADGYKITGQFKYFFPNDLVDLMDFYMTVSCKEWKKAYEKLERMDTDIREKTPLLIYDFLAEKCENLGFTEKSNYIHKLPLHKFIHQAAKKAGLNLVTSNSLKYKK